MGHPEQVYSSHESGNFLSSNNEPELSIVSDVDRFRASAEFNPVKEMSFGKPKTKDGVEFRRVDFEMRDGTFYDGSFARPVNVPGIDPDTNPFLDIGATGWWTHPRLGMNRRDQLKDAVLLGQTSLIVGPQQNLDRRGRMLNSGDDLLEMGRTLAHATGKSTEIVTTKGKSRGSMIASVVLARARFHGMAAAWAEMNAQCGSKKVFTQEGFSTLLHGLPNEGRGFGEILDHSPRALYHFAMTGDIHPRRAFQQLKELPALEGEETIDIIDEYMPADAFGVFVVDRNDILVRVAEMRSRLASRAFDMLTIDEAPDGSHIGSVASKRREKIHVRRSGAVVKAIGSVANDMIANPAQASLILHDTAVQIDPDMFISTDPLVHLQKAS